MNTDKIAAEEAKRAFIRYEEYVQKRDVWHMPPQLSLIEELLAEIVQAATEKAYEQGYMHGTENLSGALSRAAHASDAREHRMKSAKPGQNESET